MNPWNTPLTPESPGPIVFIGVSLPDKYHAHDLVPGLDHALYPWALAFPYTSIPLLERALSPLLMYPPPISAQFHDARALLHAPFRSVFVLRCDRDIRCKRFGITAKNGPGLREEVFPRVPVSDDAGM